MKRDKKRTAVWGGLIVLCLWLYFLVLPAQRADQMQGAINGGDAAQVSDLLKHGADANQEVCTQSEVAESPEWVPYSLRSALFPKTCTNSSPLLALVMQPGISNRASIAAALLKGGASVDAPDSHGSTALGLAVAQNDEAAVKILLDHGANPNKKGYEGDPPLFAALDDDKIKMLRLLMAHGAKITPSGYGQSALRQAAQNGNVAALRFLLQHEEKIDGRGSEGETPLMCAVGGNKPEAVVFLLAHGANPNAQDAEGETALHFALSPFRSYQNLWTVQPLLRGGASLFIKDKKGRMPLDGLEIVRKANGINKDDYSKAFSEGPSGPPPAGL